MSICGFVVTFATIVADWMDRDAGPPDITRGRVLGWNAATLTPLPSARLMNQFQYRPDQYYLTGVWMSGAGIASDDNGSLFFATGNSDPDGKSNNPTYNLSESVINLSADLTTVQSFYTPTSASDGWQVLDEEDLDTGSGGVLALPDQPGAVPHMAVAAGKWGNMYLLNRDNLGGRSHDTRALGVYNIGSCWCAPSYYVGSDGVARIVSSGGNNAMLWKLHTSPKAGLIRQATSAAIGNGNGTLQDWGFFTSVSSNGTQAGSGITWAVSRPYDATDNVFLFALSADTGATLYQAVAGNWPFVGGNADIVPVVANGHVFVASYQTLSIFGLSAPAKHVAFKAAPAPVRLEPVLAPHSLHGIVTAVDIGMMTLRLRDGSVRRIDLSPARAAGSAGVPVIGEAEMVQGSYGPQGVLLASVVMRQKQSPLAWGPDR